MRKPLLLLLLLAAVGAAIVGAHRPARAESVYDFKLVNKTGYAISAVYVAPSKSKNWGRNVLRNPLKNGYFVNISFKPTASAASWDMKIKWVGYDASQDVVWSNVKLDEISKLTLVYDENTNKTTALTE